jgi:hypothetical protein
VGTVFLELSSITHLGDDGPSDGSVSAGVVWEALGDVHYDDPAVRQVSKAADRLLVTT